MIEPKPKITDRGCPVVVRRWTLFGPRLRLEFVPFRPVYLKDDMLVNPKGEVLK